ncbi:hypothetical protein [Aquimarina aggregata]|uniref:hypothetical protein n=1 Tax=Aquimarina aggregata TaxID=1642818 RepID=UPI002492E731|nr:hypothetical protein [Aquimarina aggregata]
MWISVKEHIVDEEVFELKTNNCKSGKVILQLIRRDVRVSFFLFPKKVTQVICHDTGKKIKKAFWNTTIETTAEEMRKKLKVPMWGYWSLGTIALALLLAVSIGFYSEINSNADYQKSFMAQNNKQKELILQKLAIGDLVSTMNKVYKIQSIDDENPVLIESKNPVNEGNFSNGLTNEAYPESSFTGSKLKISRSKFITGIISNTDMILNVLDN